MITNKSNSTIKYPLSNSSNGYFQVCNTTKQSIKHLLLSLLMTQQGQLAYDTLFGINLQQFIFQNISLDKLLQRCKQHIINKVNIYVKQVKNIQLYINTTYTDVNKHIVYFKMTYDIEMQQSDSIQFVANQQNVSLNLN